MTWFLALTLIVFALAFGMGWWRHKSFFWNVVDILYYPMAAIGVALLFISNDVQRDLFATNERAEQERASLVALKAAKPDIKVLSAGDLLTTHVESVALVQKWVQLCDGGPSAAEPRCLAVANLGQHVGAFLRTARLQYPTYEERLSATCRAGDAMLEGVHQTEAISGLVADKLIEHFRKATSKKLWPLDYNALDAELAEFRDRTTAYAQEIHRLAFKKDDESGARLLAIRMAEIEYAEMLFRGLYQCIVAPRDDLDRLNKWTATAKTKEQEISNLEAQRERLKASTTQHTVPLWLQLHLWPFVLLLALSLKFAKGAAALRNALAKQASPITNSPPPKDPPESTEPAPGAGQQSASSDCPETKSRPS